ncbi:DUF3800 domain-containing protein [Pseudarthrobacter sp. 1C304]|uniref:DUF3800 domain-containing protein n=1 Tax=Pseudarthrobacter sp. 1C304 TaxID=3457438 RepID=UPI003FD3D5A5
MHILFSDESGSPKPPNKVQPGDLFVLGGAIIPEEVWHRVNRAMKDLQREYRAPGELKWRHFFNRSGDSPLAHLSPADKDAMREKLYAVITSTKSIRLLAVVVDQSRAYASPGITCLDDIYQRAYKVLSERFQYFLQDLQRNSGMTVNGMIVMDNRGPRDDKLLQDFHSSLVNGEGTNRSTYNNFVEGLFIAPSHHSVGIQLADMVGGAVYRAETKGDRRFLDPLLPSFRQSPQGRVEGFGIARVPHGR